MGSSIIRRAFCRARESCDTSQLDLDRYRASILWHAKGGLRWRNLLSHIKLLLPIDDPPDILVIHCGGNDVAQSNSGFLRQQILQDLKQIAILLPQTRLVWSAILPRLKWRGEVNHSSVRRIPVRINSQVASYIVGNGGGYIRYPEITDKNPALFCDDVHLSPLGNDLFLYRLQQGLQKFLSTPAKVSPPFGEFGPWQHI